MFIVAEFEKVKKDGTEISLLAGGGKS